MENKIIIYPHINSESLFTFKMYKGPSCSCSSIILINNNNNSNNSVTIVVFYKNKSKKNMYIR